MKVLACSSLVLAVLLVVAAQGQQKSARKFFWSSFLTDMTYEVCACDNAQLCVANAGRCFGDLLSEKFKVETEEDVESVKARVIECAQCLSVAGDFSTLSIESFQKFPMAGFGVDLAGLFLYYEVPENQISPMVECVGAEVFTTLRECLTSPPTNQS